MNYQNWVEKKVKVTNLMLDPENIRLEVENKSQDALIVDLFTNEDAFQILESIVRNGFFPDELPVVVKESTKITVIEGNRRIAALKVLLNPKLVPRYESRIKNMKIGNPLEAISVVFAPSRQDAQKLLANKHTQNTRRPWKPLRQAYFYHAQLEQGKTVEDLKKDYPNVDVVKFIKMWDIHKIAKSLDYDSEITTEKVFNQRKFPVSTLERLYNDTDFRNLLGFHFDENGKIKILSKKKEFENAITQVVTDAVNNEIDTRVLNDEEGKERYFSRFKKLPENQALTTSEDFKEKLPTKNKQATKLAPGDIICTLQSPGVKRMLQELQTIPYRKFPIATHDLLRSFLECSLKSYLSYKGFKISKKGFVFLNDVLTAFADDKNNLADRQYRQDARRIMGNSKMSSYSKDFLDGTNHNPDIFPTPEEVKEAWDSMEGLFRYILNPR